MKYNLIILAAVCIALLAPALSGQAQSNAAKRIDELLLPLARDDRFSGVVIASQNGTVIYEKAFGMANAELKVPNTITSRIGIASITKLMTAVVLARLLEDRKVSLDDKLAKFIPDFPQGEKITVGMLARHRSGIPHRVMPEEEETKPYTSSEMIQKIKAAKLVFEPGTQRLYSSAGYSVLTRVLEIASGQSYAQLLQKYVFGPAQMADSLDWNGPSIIERRTQDYICEERGYVNATAKDYSFLIGAGSVLSTASDVNRFASALVDGRYGESVKNDLGNNGFFSGSGSTNGHRAYFEMKGDKSYGFVILSNTGCGSFDFVQKGVSEILQGKEPTVKSLTVPKLVANPNKDLNEFSGTYERIGAGETKIFLKDGYLYAGDIKLHPVKPDCFFDFRFFGNACFSRDASRKVEGIKWSGINFELVWTRKQ